MDSFWDASIILSNFWWSVHIEAEFYVRKQGSTGVTRGADWPKDCKGNKGNPWRPTPTLDACWTGGHRVHIPFNAGTGISWENGDSTCRVCNLQYVPW